MPLKSILSVFVVFKTSMILDLKSSLKKTMITKEYLNKTKIFKVVKQVIPLLYYDFKSLSFILSNIFKQKPLYANH